MKPKKYLRYLNFDIGTAEFIAESVSEEGESSLACRVSAEIGHWAPALEINQVYIKYLKTSAVGLFLFDTIHTKFSKSGTHSH